MKLDLGALPGYDLPTKTFILRAEEIGLRVVSPYLNIHANKIHELYNALINTPETIGYVDMSNHTRVCFVEHADWYIKLDTRANALLIITSSLEYLRGLITKYSEYFTTRMEGTASVDYFYASQHGVEHSAIDIIVSTMERIYPELYPDIDIALLAKEYMAAKDSILFLTGAPGVGKTTFMRYLLQNFSKADEVVDIGDDNPFTLTIPSIAYVKDMNVMQNGEFWCRLASLKFDIIIFDDLDVGLATRDGTNNGIVSNLLSYSDGIFGSKSKIVVTTNMAVTDIDKALLRPGRCFDFLELNPLARTDALSAWVNILGMEMVDFQAQWLDHKTITQSDLVSMCYRIRESKKERSYVKNGDKTYSVEDKVKNMITPVGFK